MLSSFASKNKKRKIIALIQIIICSAITFPLEILDIVFLFSKNDFNDLTTGNQFYTLILGEFIFEWVSFILVTFVIAWAGWKFFKNAYFETFKWRRWGMSTLITLSVLISYLFSFYPLIQNTIWFAGSIKIGDNSLIAFWN